MQLQSVKLPGLQGLIFVVLRKVCGVFNLRQYVSVSAIDNVHVAVCCLRLMSDCSFMLTAC